MIAVSSRAASASRNSRSGIENDVAQCNVSFNRKKGTLRGMHFQLPPKAEAKLVRCTRGKIYDVIIDLRPESQPIVPGSLLSLPRTITECSTSPKTLLMGFKHWKTTPKSFIICLSSIHRSMRAVSGGTIPHSESRGRLPDPIMSEKDRSYAFYKKVVDENSSHRQDRPARQRHPAEQYDPRDLRS